MLSTRVETELRRVTTVAGGIDRKTTSSLSMTRYCTYLLFYLGDIWRDIVRIRQEPTRRWRSTAENHRVGEESCCTVAQY